MQHFKNSLTGIDTSIQTKWAAYFLYISDSFWMLTLPYSGQPLVSKFITRIPLIAQNVKELQDIRILQGSHKFKCGYWFLFQKTPPISCCWRHDSLLLPQEYSRKHLASLFERCYFRAPEFLSSGFFQISLLGSFPKIIIISSWGRCTRSATVEDLQLCFLVTLKTRAVSSCVRWSPCPQSSLPVRLLAWLVECMLSSPRSVSVSCWCAPLLLLQRERLLQ